MMNRIKTPALAAIAALTMSGCVGDLLDVDNPNSLVEESIELPAAANGLANGALVETADAIAWRLLALAVASDEGNWTGSRDAWGQLDQGYVADPLNEFTDAAFPELGEAVWLGRKAALTLEGHVTELGNEYRLDWGRALMFYGIAMMITGEVQEDMTFSDKKEAGAALGPANMYTVLDSAVALFSKAIDQFAAEGDADLEAVAKGLRARASMSRTIWDQLNPTATVGGALSYGAQTLSDAQAVLTAAAGSDWYYNVGFTSASRGSYTHDEVNNRGEQQWDSLLVELTGSGTGDTGRTGKARLVDPFSTATPQLSDPAVEKALAQFGGNQYAEITLTSARLMRMILAEHALSLNTAAGDTEFEAQINALRDLDPTYENYTRTDANEVDALKHHRRVNTLWMGLRLQDMYRWGIKAQEWQPTSDAMVKPGQMLPIAIVECRANPNLNDVTCAPESGG